MKNIKRITLVSFFLFAGLSLNANASLIGQKITASGTSLSPSGPVTIGDGIEFRYSDVDIDFTADSLTLSLTTFPFVSGYTYTGSGPGTFSGFSSNITNLSIASNNGFSGSILKNFSFGPSSITLDFDSFFARNAGKLVFKIETVDVPEPATVGLIGLGLLGLAVSLQNQKGRTRKPRVSFKNVRE